MNPVIDSSLAYTAEPVPIGSTGPKVETIIESGDRWLVPNLHEIWTYRELLLFLVWRDVKVRYKQTALGAGWAVLQPILSMLVFTLLFGRLAKFPSDNIPYPLFVYTALLPWQLFSFALNESSNSLVANQHLIRKVYFPRLIIPISAVLVGLMDFAISLVVLGGMMAYYGVRPASTSLLFIPFLILAVITALGIGIWLSALNIKYRDVKYLIPVVTQVWMFASPVAYSSKLVPARWHYLYSLNPMAGVVDGFRWALLGVGDSGGMALTTSIGAVLVVLVGGLAYFKRMERSFADMV